MGTKVNPIGFRLAVNKDWRSKWYAEGKDYTNKLSLFYWALKLWGVR
jgi:small subunit ribosomal protein S3